MMRRIWPPLAGAAVVVLAGCAATRGVAIESEPGPAYALEVTNAAAYDMRVSYADGSGTYTLGIVQAGETERFVISSPAGLAVTVIGTDSAGGREVRRAVTLQSGATTRVRLAG